MLLLTVKVSCLTSGTAKKQFFYLGNRFFCLMQAHEYGWWVADEKNTFLPVVSQYSTDKQVAVQHHIVFLKGTIRRIAKKVNKDVNNAEFWKKNKKSR